MDQSAYVTGFFGVLIGITLTELIKGIAETIRHKERVKYYIPHGILVGAIFIFLIQSFFDFQWFSREVTSWTPILLIRFTLPWILICLASYLVFPSFDGDDIINFKDQFDRFCAGVLKLMLPLIPLIISFHIFYLRLGILYFQNPILLGVWSLIVVSMVLRKNWHWLKILFVCLAASYGLYNIIYYGQL